MTHISSPVVTFFFFSSRRRHTRSDRDWSSDVCSSDLSEWLQRLLNEVANGVQDPETGVSSQARLRARLMVSGYEKGATEQDKKLAKLAAAGGDLPIKALGSGSDFTPFIQHLGVTTLSLEYGGEDDQEGVYHSNYDSFDHYVRFGDPNFVYGVAEAQTVGHLVLRMVDADVLPLQFGS